MKTGFYVIKFREYFAENNKDFSISFSKVSFPFILGESKENIIFSEDEKNKFLEAWSGDIFKPVINNLVICPCYFNKNNTLVITKGE